MTAIPIMDESVSTPTKVHRIVVHPKPGEVDPVAASALSDGRKVIGELAAVSSSTIFLIEAPIDDDAVNRIASELVTDPVTQHAVIGASHAPGNALTIEIHYKPGVMDPVAQSTRDAIIEMFPQLSTDTIEVRTGRRFDFQGDIATHSATAFAEKNLANPVIQDIHVGPYHPDQFEHGSPYNIHLTHVSIRDLDDDGLKTLSRDGHLFLSLDEMRGVQSYYRQVDRDPTDVELETLAQTWSEHCVHKTLKSTIRYREDEKSDLDFSGRPGHEINEDGSVTINNLLKSTIAAATKKLMESEPHNEWCISVFEDNAGIVGFDDEDAVCIKVETHNHPSAIEPYGGAATGIGGCIRDVMGTGLSARPIANTDVFCVASPDINSLPKGVLHPKRILQQVVGGVRDYGNRMGIPTVNGAVYFHDDYLGNPLVYCGCIGLIPNDKCFGDAQPGDHIIALGGRTGRDGIHGATFSSAELTDSHADEFSHAVQIGNAITEKKTMDVILEARDFPDGPLYSAITDCGAGGFSSAVGEMGEKVGANVKLENAPLKYQGLSYTEIWISEAQERMVLSVPAQHVETIRAMCDAEDVEMCDLGTFGVFTEGENPEPLLVLNYHDTEVGRLSMDLLHNGIPTPTREAEWKSRVKSQKSESQSEGLETFDSRLLTLLSHPNIASKHWIIRQYDHEVQGGSVVKPLTGPQQDGPSDAAVVRPKLTSDRGIAISCGLQTGMSEKSTELGFANDGDSYWMTLAAIDEAVRNCVCVGADPSRIAILDNFCWPGCDDPAQLATLVRAAEGCHDAALAYSTPFVSGKDSLNNQFTTDDGDVITIPQTLLITALGIVPDVTKCVTSDAKSAGNALIIVGTTTNQIGGSHYAMTSGGGGDGDLTIPRVDLKQGPANAAAIANLVGKGLVASAHDCSDGGLLVAAAEMAFTGRIGLDLDLESLPGADDVTNTAACFAETPSRYLLEVPIANIDAVVRTLRDANIPFGQIGTFGNHNRLTLRTPRNGNVLDVELDRLRQAWLEPLSW